MNQVRRTQIKFVAPLVLFFRSSTRLSSLPEPSRNRHPTPLKPSATLTGAEIAEVDFLIPRLCSAGRLLDAVRIIDACLLTESPLCSLPLPFISDRLAAHQDMVPTVALLTALRHHPRHPSPLPFCSLLLSSYLRSSRSKEAFKIFLWLLRPDSPCRPDADIYRTAIVGFCRLGKTMEALQAMREMVRDGLLVTGDHALEVVYRSLLREARIPEAQELNAALGGAAENGDGFSKAAELLDRILVTGKSDTGRLIFKHYVIISTEDLRKPTEIQAVSSTPLSHHLTLARWVLQLDVSTVELNLRGVSLP